jgi:choloylglycine hydrolase
VADHKNLVYYYESTLTPDTFWVNFKDIDFSPKGEVKKLSLDKGQTYSGNAVKSFVKSAPFKFLGV